MRKSYLKDPFGTQIHIPENLLAASDLQMDENQFLSHIHRVILNPDYMIFLLDKGICYLGAVEIGTNIMLCTKHTEQHWQVISYSKNPEPETISKLLKKGRLKIMKS